MKVTNSKDLFENQNALPPSIRKQIDLFEHNVENRGKDRYKECTKLFNALNRLGYTFEFGLDGVPYELREI